MKRINQTRTGGLARALFTIGARKRRELGEDGQSSFLTNLKFRLADRIVFRKIREHFGGRLNTAITGSATMNVEIGHFFSDLGIPVYDCYGLTETIPAVTMNCPGAHRPGSVDRPIDQVTVEIDKLFLEEAAVMLEAELARKSTRRTQQMPQPTPPDAAVQPPGGESSPPTPPDAKVPGEPPASDPKPGDTPRS